MRYTKRYEIIKVNPATIARSIANTVSIFVYLMKIKESTIMSRIPVKKLLQFSYNLLPLKDIPS
jgi:hypothetical protein